MKLFNGVGKTLRTVRDIIVFGLVMGFFSLLVISFLVASKALEVLVLALLIGAIVIIVSAVVATFLIEALEGKGGGQ